MDGFDQVLFSMRDAAVLIERRTGKVLDCNPACERLLGYNRDELAGSHISRFVADTPDFKPMLRRAIRRIAKDGFFAESIGFLNRQGERAYQDTRCTYLETPSGRKCVLAILHVRDQPDGSREIIRRMSKIIEDTAGERAGGACWPLSAGGLAGTTANCGPTSSTSGWHFVRNGHQIWTASPTLNN